MSHRARPHRPGLAALVAAACLVAAPSAAPAGSGFEPPAPVVRTLPNGLTIAVLHDDRLPIVQLQLLVPAGAAQEPAGEAGVANLTAQMLNQGTASRSAADFAAAVEALGGSVGGNVSREFATASGTFLAGDFEAGLELLGDAVMHPLFSEEPLLQVKGQMDGALLRARQNPLALADEHLWAAVFPGHPYGRSPMGAPRAIHGLGVAQVRAFHRAHYRPDRALLAVAGDVTPARAFRAAEDLLGSWGGQAAGQVPAPPEPPPGWRVRLVDAPGLPRVELRIGAAGPPHRNADHLALTVAGELLAGGAPIPLRAAVTGLSEGGLFSLAASAPVESVGPALDRLREAIRRWRAAPAADDEAEAVRRRLAGSFRLQFETLGGRMAHWMAAMYYGAPAGRLAEYEESLRALTATTAWEAAARWVPAAGLVLVAIGPAEVLRAPLEAIGPVEVIPAGAAFEVVESPSTAVTPPSADQLRRGRALAGQAADAHGGLQRLRGIKDSTLEGEIVMTPGPRQQVGRMVQMRKEPDRFLFSTAFPVLRSVQAMDGDRGWVQMGQPPGEVEDLDSLAVLGLRAGFRSDLPHLLLTANDPSSRVAWRGQESRADREADVLEVVDASGERRLLFLDATSHELVAMEQNEAGQSARRLYGDLREVGGVRWPFTEERLLDGQRALSLRLNRVVVNTGLKDELFRRPGAPVPARGSRPRPR